MRWIEIATGLNPRRDIENSIFYGNESEVERILQEEYDAVAEDPVFWDSANGDVSTYYALIGKQDLHD